MDGPGRGDPVKVTTEIHGVKVTVTVEMADTVGSSSSSGPTAEVLEGAPPTPGAATAAPDPAAAGSGDPVVLGGGRQLPDLLFVTNKDRLGDQIGATEAEFVVSLLRDARQRVLLVSGDDPAQIAGGVRNSVRDSTVGVVIIGGYTVVPSFRLDTLPPEAIDAGVTRRSDLDRFIIWSDDAYVDLDGDNLPELPISRVPDAHSALVCVRQLCASPAAPAGRSGVRNVARPFSDSLVGSAPHDTPLVVSHPADSSVFQPAWVSNPLTYLMLHGSDIDGTRLWGEDPDRHPIETLAVADLPAELEGTFFSAACWGGLIVSQTAQRARAGRPLADRVDNQSFALSTLARGAHAYVGCTGTHYSPKGKAAHKYGGPFHLAFLDAFAGGALAAEATWKAKQSYLEYVAQITDATELAYATKILSLFTCLGLGW